MKTATWSLLVPLLLLLVAAFLSRRSRDGLKPSGHAASRHAAHSRATYGRDRFPGSPTAPSARNDADSGRACGLHTHLSLADGPKAGTWEVTYSGEVAGSQATCPDL